jgi:hypothetical protein
MSIVPYATHSGTYQYRRGYMPIYEIGGRENVNVAQLVLNISFAALAGVLVSNLSRRAALWVIGGLAIAVTAWFGLPAYDEQMKAGAETEERLAHGAILDGNFGLAKEHLLKAANYWKWKGWAAGARDATNRAFDGQEMKEQAAAFHAEKSEERARQLLRITNIYAQFD